MSDPARILAVDDSMTQLFQLRTLLESDGYEVVTAADGQEALEKIEQMSPDLVVTDLQMPILDGLELVKAISQQIQPIPVILTTGAGSEMIAAKALHAGAASYVPKESLASMLLSTVRRTLELKEATRPNPELASCLQTMAVEWKLRNDQSLVPRLIGRVEGILHELGISDPSSHMHVTMALDEAILNAMIHGNLEVDSSLRHTDNEQPFYDKIRERTVTKPYCDREVYLRLEADREKASFMIRDEGPGFCVADLPDPNDPVNLEKEGGRGLLLIHAFMDEVRHNESGNEITMVKNCTAVDDEAADDE